MRTMIHVTILLGAALLGLAPVTSTAIAADKIQPTQDRTSNHGLIQPTSPGSSGESGSTTSGAESNPGGDVNNYAINPLPSSGSQAPSEMPAEQEGSSINAYPNATNGAGMPDGGSVTGTGALNSAHPGH
jgi:hypothetical protein